MALLNTDAIALMAFATEDIVEQWRSEVIEAERQKEQKLDVTTYSRKAHRDIHTNIGHTDRYSQSAAADIYSNIAARDVYSRTAHVDTYSRTATRDIYTQVAARDTYSQVAARDTYSQTAARDRYSRMAHSNSYSRAARRDSYSRTAHRNSYSRAAHRNSYSRRAHTDRYSRRRNNPGYTRAGRYARYNDGAHKNSAARNRYKRSARRNSYSRTAHRDSYSRAAHRNSYSRRAHVDTYSRVAHRNTYTRVAHTDSYARATHTNTYSQQTAVDRYTETAERDQYGRIAHKDAYSRGVAVDTYSRIAPKDEYARSIAIDQGFDHENYIPSAPEFYNLDGQVISDDLEVRLASYDKNGDGFGTQDNESIDIYYNVEIRQVQNIFGEPVEDEWHTLAKNSMTMDFDIALEEYEDGIYEIRSIAYNQPRTEKGVTKEYVSNETIATFTIMDGGAGQDLTILNAPEFQDYIYGIDTYVNTSDEIKKYVDSIIYEKSDNQRGLFLEIKLEDVDTSTYHKTKASLEIGGEAITDQYDVIYETNDDGTPKTGSKIGLVFIPLEDMLDDGCYEDVNIRLETDEFRDPGFTKQKGTTNSQYGLNEARDIVYVDVDGENPTATVSDPSPKKTLEDSATFAFSDVGLGLRNKEYQIIKDGDPDTAEWHPAESEAFTVDFTEPGKYQVTARAVDKAGNTHATQPKTFVVNYVDQEISTPKKVTQGGTFIVQGNIDADIDVRATEFWIQDYTSKKVGAQTELTINAETGRDNSVYQAALTTPNDIPLGEHVVFMKVTYEDGITKTVSTRIEVVELITSEITPIESDKDSNEINPYLIKNEKGEDTLIIQKDDYFTPIYYQKTLNSNGEDISDTTTYISNVPLEDGRATTPGTYDVVYHSEIEQVSHDETSKFETDFTLHVIVNDPPVIKAERIYLFSGDVSKERIIKKLSVIDKEDGRIYLTEDDIELSKKDDDGYDVEITAIDSMKGKTVKNIELKVVGTADVKEGPRYIDIESFAVLSDLSIWTEETYNQILEESLNNTDNPIYEKHVNAD